MDYSVSEDQLAIKEGIRSLCERFPDKYWRELDARREYPEEFVRALSDAGFLATLIPQEFGGAGLGVTEAAIIVEEIHASGGNANAGHAQMYTMGTLLRHGSPEQKQRYLPKLAAGSLRLQAFGVTEPNAGSDTLRIRTRAERRGNHYIINGQKVFISRVIQSDLMLLLARTTPLEELTPKDRTKGLSVFVVDLREAGDAIEARPIDVMFNQHTYSLFINDLHVPAGNLIGEAGQGFRYILDGMNVERILIASEAIGDGRWFVRRAVQYASEREVFDRRIGANQGIQFPVARAHASVEAASLVRFQAASLFDKGEPSGAAANMAKLLASEASWEAANACVMTYGGYAFAAEYDVERKFREAKLLQIAPVSNNLVLAYLGHKVLGMPRSY